MVDTIMIGSALGANWTEALNGKSVDMILTDPPWNQSVLTGFCNRAGIARISISDMHSRLIDLYRAICPNGPIVMEMGLQHCDEVCSLLVQAGYPQPRIINTTYQGKRPSVILAVNIERKTYLSSSSWDMIHDICASVIRPQWLVCDPCCGHGKHLRVAQSCGASIIGCEVNGPLARTTAERLGAHAIDYTKELSNGS